MQLFQPQVITSIKKPIESALSMTRTPEEIVSHAIICLETLMRLYYIRHNYDNYHDFFMWFLILLGNMAIEALDGARDGSNLLLTSPDVLRSTLILCAKGLKGQGRSHHLGNLTFRALKDRVAPRDLHLLQTYCHPGGESDDESSITQHSQSFWPIPIIRINEDPDLARLDNLLTEYQQLSLENTSVSSQGATPEPQ